MQNLIDDLRAKLDELEAAVTVNTDSRVQRVVSVKAKNLRPGDVIEWPYDLGRQTVNMPTKWPDRVDVSADRSSTPFARFDPDGRVRVYERA